MPLNGASFYKNESSGDSTYKINHYLEAVDGSGGAFFMMENTMMEHQEQRL